MLQVRLEGCWAGQRQAAAGAWWPQLLSCSAHSPDVLHHALQTHSISGLPACYLRPCRLLGGAGESYDGLLRYFLRTKQLMEKRGPLPTSRQDARARQRQKQEHEPSQAQQQQQKTRQVAGTAAVSEEQQQQQQQQTREAAGRATVSEEQQARQQAQRQADQQAGGEAAGAARAPAQQQEQQHLVDKGFGMGCLPTTISSSGGSR